MKMLFMHAQNLRIKAGAKSGKNGGGRKRNEDKLRERLGEVLPILDDSNKETKAENALLVFVCVEKGDNGLDLLDDVKEAILRSRQMLGVEEIVIAAFAHLSENSAEPELARRMMSILTYKLKEDGLNIKEVPFGWDKSLDLYMPLHHYNCSFASFTNQWNEIAFEFDDYMLESGHYRAQHMALMKVREHIREPILDLCCGSGRNLHQLHRMIKEPFTYVGIDSSAEMIRFARKMASVLETPLVVNNGSEIKFICGDIEHSDDLPKDVEFNTVLMFNATAYTSFIAPLLAVGFRMKKGAKLIVAEENPFIVGPEMSEKIRRIIERPRLSLDQIKYRIEGLFKFIKTQKVRIDKDHGMDLMIFEQNT
ncbi:methyltransferase domain-containing protein [Candidatus Micrarchaeota archaeon]|nr:methyltransferase domain-containing protein [Candidatus Micrarchaeota archaeon]